MICQECGIRQATVHFTKIINGEKAEYHLCEVCAQGKSDTFINTFHSPNLSLNNLLAGFFNVEPKYPEPFETRQMTRCANCGMTFEQFLEVGKFGCARCYDAFHEKLTPVLKRIQGGNWKHNGKIPRRTGAALQLRKKIEILKETLQNLVAKEEFEKAAEVRDEIRMYEKILQEGGDADVH